MDRTSWTHCAFQSFLFEWFFSQAIVSLTKAFLRFFPLLSFLFPFSYFSPAHSVVISSYNHSILHSNIYIPNKSNIITKDNIFMIFYWWLLQLKHRFFLFQKEMWHDDCILVQIQEMRKNREKPWKSKTAKKKVEEKLSKMVADCGATCAKYLLCVFNFVFFVSTFFVFLLSNFLYSL